MTKLAGKKPSSKSTAIFSKVITGLLLAVRVFIRYLRYKNFNGRSYRNIKSYVDECSMRVNNAFVDNDIIVTLNSNV